MNKYNDTQLYKQKWNIAKNNKLMNKSIWQKLKITDKNLHNLLFGINSDWKQKLK